MMAAEERAKEIAEELIGRLVGMHLTVGPSMETAIADELSRAVPVLYREAEQRMKERCAELCEEQVKRPAGYHGQWEGHGSWMDDKTGPECALAIRALPSEYGQAQGKAAAD